ncbi:beta-ketoacyl-[acyl-carrier-protein] synthase family protein [Luteolibacter algae]|uniref:Beta-ketoacyl-[acyl-carrier-protein] synthase family protein n=1 Tax=Luteolibacter algae TaxID=454151 RepID=A0ABW5D7H4_9BACT
MQNSPDSTQNFIPRRVFITGTGMISPMGTDSAGHVASLRAGENHFREIDFFDVSKQRVKTAGVADLADDFEHFMLSEREARGLDRGTRLLLHATAQAMNSAKLDNVSPETGFIVGTSAGAMPVGEEYYKIAARDGERRGQFRRVENYQAQRQAGAVQRALGFRAQTLIISNACASGANAIGHAYHQIRSGRKSLALAGGYDALCQLVFAGFDALQALAESGIPRPFDAARDGLALGEGAAMFVLESEESMLDRGAVPLVEICGYGMATDLHHLTQPHPEGNAAVRSMTGACRQAGMEPREIDYINSHGTGTPLNDVAEANAITEWAGEDAKQISVSSTKSAMGHLLGGAGAIESAICLLALKNQLLPASLNIREADPACRFDLVREPREAALNVALTNSFGFGGSNASLIFRNAS